MTNWVRTGAGSDPATLHAYVNLDLVQVAQVVATVSGPAGYTIEFGDADGSDLGSVYGRWDTADEANAALRLMFHGFDLGATEGEEVA
jgi:hypothetical protein